MIHLVNDGRGQKVELFIDLLQHFRFIMVKFYAAIRRDHVLGAVVAEELHDVAHQLTTVR